MKMLEDLAEVVRLRDAAEYAAVALSSEEFAEADKAYSDKAAIYIATHHATIRDMAKELKVLRLKCAGSLANNLCPDHRDKQTGKPCLACENEKLAKRLEAAERDAARCAYGIRSG